MTNADTIADRMGALWYGVLCLLVKDLAKRERIRLRCSVTVFAFVYALHGAIAVAML